MKLHGNNNQVATGVLVFFQKMCTENQKLGKTFGSQAFVGVIIIGVIFSNTLIYETMYFFCLGQMSLCVMLIFR